MAQSNIFEAGAAEIPQLFGDYIEGSVSGEGCIVLVLSTSPLGDVSRNALAKSFTALGFGNDVCTYATVLPACSNAEGGDIPLDSQALFLLVEGLDPLRVVAADDRARDELASAYRMVLQPNTTARIFGRPAAIFSSLDTLLETDEGKHKAWSLFKTLG